MKPRSLLVLLLVVLGLGAFVWFYERKLPTSEEAKAQEKKVLPGVEADQVREVQIVRDGATVRLVRVGGAPPAEAPKEPAGEVPALGAAPAEWRLETSGAGVRLAARADRTAVEGLISSLLGIDKVRTLAKADRKEYGLAPPAAQVTLTTAKGKRVLEVGREIPATDQRAVALAGEEAVHVVASSFWSELAKAPGDWRSKELFGGSREDVERVSLQHGAAAATSGGAGGGKALLARRGEEPWIEVPLADRADPERFDQLVDALTALQAVEFLDNPPGPPAALGLEPPQDVIEVVRKGQATPFRLELGAVRAEPNAAPTPSAAGGAPSPATPDQPLRYARADGALVTIKAPLAEALARPAQDWRSRAWTTFAVYEIDKVELKDAQGALTLTRAESDWKRGNVKIFFGTVSDLLSAVADAKADRVLAPADVKGIAVGAPALTLVLTGTGGKRQTLTLWSPAPGGAAGAGGVPAQTSGREATLMMPVGLAADLAQKVAAIRKAEPLKEAVTPTLAPPK